MSKPAGQSGERPNRNGRGCLVLILLAVAAAVGGFVAGMQVGPSLGLLPATTEPKVVQVDAGTFPVAMPGARPRIVNARLSLRAEGAPVEPASLQDAVLVLLTEASSLPLALDGRDSLSELERIALAMAPASAPWLVGLELELVTAQPATARNGAGAGDAEH